MRPQETSGPSWGGRWIGSLSDVGRSAAERLERGRYAARRGLVQDLAVGPGRLRARVREGRTRPLQVTVTVPTFDAAAWERVADLLSDELRHTAALIDGQLPEEVEGTLRTGGITLVPAAGSVEVTCTCGERRMPCRHVAAVHHEFAARLDDDPLLLVELRGHDRDTLLAALRRRRSGHDAHAPAPGTVPLMLLRGREPTGARGDLDALPLRPHPVEDPAWLFHHLGDPPGVDDTSTLEAHIASAADLAWRLAAGEGAGAADEELLLAELRTQRMATAADVGTALGWSEEQTRDVLDRMFDEGKVLRTGAGEAARYRATAGR